MKKTYIVFFIMSLIGITAGVLLFRPQARSQAQKVEEVALPAQAAAATPVVAPAATTSKQELILVPAGSFEMGNDAFRNAKPVHKVTLTNDFYMGKYEVTNQQYADMLNFALSKGYLDVNALSETSKRREARGVSKSPQKYQDVFDEHSKITFENGQFKPHPGKESAPVDEVTWYGGAFYCNMLSEQGGLTPLYNLDDWSCQVYGKAGYRLPTEAEWEYAAKYDDGRKYPWGDQEPDDTYANIKKQVNDPVDVLTTPVGTYSPKGDSKLGICDLAGNVAEWCNDWYNDFYSGASTQTDPVGPPPSLYFYLAPFKEFRTANVLRGGGFIFDANYRKEMGAPFIIDTVLHEQAFNNSFRSFDYQALSRQVEGFRVAKTVVTAKTKLVFSKGLK